MVKIRLMRVGSTKRPFYRVVVADSRSPRDGRFIEKIGVYQPLADPSVIDIDADRATYWLSRGAQPTSQVRNLLRIQGVLGGPDTTGSASAAAAGQRGEAGETPS